MDATARRTSTNHKNLLTGATSALSADSLKKAIQIFLNQTDADGQPISVEPSILLVPTALKFLAVELTRGAALIMSVTAACRLSGIPDNAGGCDPWGDAPATKSSGWPRPKAEPRSGRKSPRNQAERKRVPSGCSQRRRRLSSTQRRPPNF